MTIHDRKAGPQGQGQQSTAPVYDIMSLPIEGLPDVTPDMDVGLLGTHGFVLPDLPTRPGYHRAWIRVPTSLVPDPGAMLTAIQNLHYRPIKPEHLPGLEIYGHATSQFGPVLQIKDVIACEVPTPIYDKIMAQQQAQTDILDNALYEVPEDMQGKIKVRAIRNSDNHTRRNGGQARPVRDIDET